MQTEVRTIHRISGFAALLPSLRLYFKRLGHDDCWNRYAMRLGPLYLSWSVARS